MPVVQVDPTFFGLLAYLQQDASSASAGTMLQGQRSWAVPPLNGWSGNPLDVQGTTLAFDRTDLNNAYNLAVTLPALGGTVGDCAAAKLQIDYVAVMERAFRTRHATRIRCAAHAASRKAGHGDPGGIIMGSVLKYIQNVIRSGSDNPALIP